MLTIFFDVMQRVHNNDYNLLHSLIVTFAETAKFAFHKFFVFFFTPIPSSKYQTDWFSLFFLVHFVPKFIHTLFIVISKKMC